MRKLLLALACLSLCGFGPVTMIGGGVPAAGGSFTSFTNYPETFESAPTTCTDLTVVNGVLNWNCNDTAPALNGTYSAENSSTAANLRLETSFADQNGTFECRWLQRHSTLGSSVATTIFESKDAATDMGFEVRLDETNGHLSIRSHSGGITDDAADSTYAVDTTYKLCVNYDVGSDLTTLYIDSAAGSYCAGAIDTLVADGTDSVAANIDGVAFFATVSTEVYSVDDIDCGTP